MTDILSVNENGKQYLWKTHLLLKAKSIQILLGWDFKYLVMSKLQNKGNSNQGLGSLKKQERWKG